MKEIKISINFIVKTADCKMETIIACYKKLSILILAEVAMQILREFAIQYIRRLTRIVILSNVNPPDARMLVRRKKER